MRVVLVTALVLALTAVGAPAAMAHYPARGKLCKPIQFQAQTDSGASGLYAKRVKCRTARRMVRAYHNGDKTPRDFSCRSRDHDDPMGLAHTDVKCTRGERRVTFALY